MASVGIESGLRDKDGLYTIDLPVRSNRLLCRLKESRMSVCLRKLSLILLPMCCVGQTASAQGSSNTRPELVLQLGHTKQISALAFSANGEWVASAGEDLTVKIWDLSTGTVVRTIQTGKRIATLAISPDSKLLAGGEGSSSCLALGRQANMTSICGMWPPDAN